MKRYLLALTAAIITAGSCLYAQKNENQTLLNAALHGWEIRSPGRYQYRRKFSPAFAS